MEIFKTEAGYVISLGRGRFVKNGIGLRSPVKVFKTLKGAENYINKKSNN